MRLCTIDPREEALPVFHSPELNSFGDTEHAIRIKHVNATVSSQPDFIVNNCRVLQQKAQDAYLGDLGVPGGEMLSPYPVVAGSSTVAARRNFAASSGGVGLI